MLLPISAAIRRAMRRHQNLPSQGGRRPLWRLVGGELLWALGQLVAAPWVLAGLLLGFVMTLAVFDAAAPGPVLEAPWRVLVAIGAGLALASSARTLPWSAREARGGDGRPRRPLTAAGEVAGVITLLVLLVWLVTWGVSVITD